MRDGVDTWLLRGHKRKKERKTDEGEEEERSIQLVLQAAGPRINAAHDAVFVICYATRGE